MKTTLRIALPLLFCIMFCLFLTPAVFADNGDFTLPANTTVIEDGAFADCIWMKSVTIPADVTRIGDCAFYGCSRLSDVFYNGTAEQWGKISIGNDNTPLLNAVIHCSDTATMLASGVWGDLEWAFFSNGLLSFSGTGSMNNVESGITPAWHSYKDQIIEIAINDGISSIGDRAFIDFAKLQSISIPQSVTTVGAYALNGCISLETIHLPDNLRIIGTNAFAYCHNLINITIPNTVASIGGAAFWDCENLTSIVIPEGITSLENNMFYHCYALNKVTLPNSLRTISSGAFMYCVGLKEITIPNQVKTIGDYSFADCNHLSLVSFSDQVESIGNGAFEGCSALEHVYFDGTQTQWNAVTVGIDNNPLSSAEIHFNSGPSNIIASGVCGDGITWGLDNTGLLTICGTGPMTDYSMQMFNDYSYYPAPWYDYHEMISVVEIEEGITSTGNYSFYNCNNLTSISFPKGMLSIGEHAFRECKNLTYVSFPKSLQSIGYAAFYGCSSLIAVNMSEEITNIGEAAFYNCGALAEMLLPKSLSNLGDQAFRNCSSMTNVTVPGSVSMIGTAAFLDCSSLINVTIQEGVGRIEKDAFRNCTSLTSLRLPGSVSTIGEAAFMDCSAVTSITMLEGITEIGGHAFRNCGSLVSVEIPESVTSIGYAAFYDCRKLETVYYGGTQTQWGAINIGSYNQKLNSAKNKYYNSDGTEANYSEMVSGILQSGDGWQIKWEVLYNIVSGVRTNAFLKIYIEGESSAEDSLFLNSMLEDGVIMPWLTEPYNFQKTDFEKIYIVGSIANPLNVIPNQFSGYSNVQTIQLDFVEMLQSNAFSDCTSLETVIFDGWLDFIGNSAFKNDANLYKLYNRSKINKFETIGDEAFMNTGLTSFDFHSALKTIGDRAFIGSQLTSVEIGPNVTSIGENAFDHSIIIYCYPNSAALQYAKDENIDYRFINTSEKTVVYSDIHGSYSVQFGPNELSIPSTAGVYNKDMAVLCGMLCQASYGGSGAELEKLYQQMFKGVNMDIVLDYVDDAFCSGIALAEMVFDEQEMNVLVITVRGTQNWGSEVYADLSISTTDMWGNETYSEIINFQNRVLSNLNDLLARHPDFADKPVKIIVTGHSLGGAAANLLSAMFTRNLSSSPENIWAAITTQSDIYGYTFGAIDALSPNSNGNPHPIKEGFENIHNIFNIYDEIASSSDFIRGSGLAGEGKYGHMDYYARDNRDNMLNKTENHEMYRYLEAVATAWVGEQQM